MFPKHGIYTIEKSIIIQDAKHTLFHILKSCKFIEYNQRGTQIKMYCTQENINPVLFSTHITPVGEFKTRGYFQKS